MSIQRQVVMTCDLCLEGGPFAELSDAQTAGWVTLAGRPAGSSTDYEAIRTWTVCPRCWSVAVDEMGGS